MALDKDGSDRQFLVALIKQTCENIRHIKNERLWFTNIYVLTVAGTLAFVHSLQGDRLLEVAIFLVLFVFSTLGVLTSLRLKAELEFNLSNLDALLKEVRLERYILEAPSGGIGARYIKLRWIYPVFYSVASAGFLALAVHRAIRYL